MKTNLLFTLLLLLFCTAVYAQNTYVPDDNFEQALIDLGFDSGELDDSVATAAIDTVSILKISEKNISDITGIEAFTSIVEFWCYRNNIFELDFSNNILLEVLYCGDNPASTINISNNPELRLLNFKEGQITEIDLSNNTKLEKLYCRKNNLTQLDVSNNPELFRLFCEENQLNTLNVSNNPKLEQLRAFQNNLTSIDLSSCMLLADIQLYNNKITAIDFSYNTKLNYISVSYNQLIEIDVSNCPKLENLGFEGNSVSAIDVSNCPKLESLTCSKNEIISLDIRNNPVLRNLLARDNQLSELNLKNGNIEGLDRMNALNNPDLICIDVEDVEAANAKHSLKWLKDETANYSEDCGNFAEQLTYIPDDNFEQALIDLGYDDGELDDSVATIQISHRTYLDLRNRDISDLTGIEDFTSLEELNCSDNDISFFDELPFLINLKELQMQVNQLVSLNTS
ncbi:MAG: hypothetical protein K9H26_17620, partial [Prolixibacteraceae bacterium]|nr:hypothetical protein [Prolixibacteraceae bacterium]